MPLFKRKRFDSAPIFTVGDDSFIVKRAESGSTGALLDIQDENGNSLFTVGSNGVVGPITVTTGSIELGTGTTGDYVEALNSGTGVTITNNTGEGSIPTIAIGQDVSTTSEVTFSRVNIGGAGSGGQKLVFEGATDNAYETTVDAVDPTADRTIYLPNADGTIALTSGSNGLITLGTDTAGNYVSDVTGGTGVTVTHTPGEGSSPTIAIGQSVATNASVEFNTVKTTRIYSQNVGSGETDIRFRNPTSDNTIYVPDVDGNFAITSGTDGSITLGADTIGNYMSGVSAGTGISVTHTPSEGSSATIGLDASINDLNDVTISSASGGDFLKWNGSAWVNEVIDLGTDTAGNYVSDVSAGTGISVSHTPGEGSTPTVSLNAGLNELTDSVVVDPEKFQSINFDGANWVNSYAPVVSYVRNAETTTLTVGTVVYLFGGTGDHASVKRADNSSDTTSSKTIGIVGSNIAASENGPIVTRGYVSGMNLSAYSVGDVLWLGTSGSFTTVKPTAPNHLVFVGVVVRASNNGIIYVATQNGYELDELHDVSITNRTEGDFLKYNGTLWVNDQINLGTDTVGNYMSDVTAGTGISITHTPGEGSNATIAVNTGTIATVAYVDSVAAGINWHEAVKYATTAVLPNAPTYSNGVLGVDATLTGTSNGQLVVDGQNVNVGERVLVQNQANAVQNGIYRTIDQGSGSGPYVLMRASDADNSVAGQVKAGDAVFVGAGTVHANQGFILTSQGTGTAGAHILGTDPLTYTQFTGTANITAGNGLTKTGNSLDVGTASTGRIVVNADNIDLATVSQTNTTGTAGVAFVQSQTIDSYGRVTGTVTADVRDATTSVKGVASFDSNSFSTSSGAVSIKANGVSNAQLANSSLTVGTTSISLGSSSTTLAGLTSVTSTAFTGELTGNASTASALQTARTISLGGDLSGSASFNGSADVTITATIGANSVALGTDTTGAYVASLVAGSGITLTNNSGESATPTITVDPSAFLPAGTLIMWAGSGAAPSGWLLCDGTAVSRTTYSALFTAVGTTYGSGNGSTTFNLPDMKGRVPVGQNASDTAFDVLGETGGSKDLAAHTHDGASHTHTGTTATEGAHTHTYADFHTDGGAAVNFGSAYQVGQYTQTTRTTSAGSAHSHTFTTSAPASVGTTGSTGAGNAGNLQPYIVLKYIIKT